MILIREVSSFQRCHCIRYVSFIYIHIHTYVGAVWWPALWGSAVCLQCKGGGWTAVLRVFSHRKSLAICALSTRFIAGGSNASFDTMNLRVLPKHTHTHTHTHTHKFGVLTRFPYTQLKQGVEPVVTSTLQGALHSLGGVQVIIFIGASHWMGYLHSCFPILPFPGSVSSVFSAGYASHWKCSSDQLLHVVLLLCVCVCKIL